MRVDKRKWNITIHFCCVLIITASVRCLHPAHEIPALYIEVPSVRKLLELQEVHIHQIREFQLFYSHTRMQKPYVQIL